MRNFTKAESLDKIQKNISKKIVPNFFFFTKKNFLRNQNYYLNKIKKKFKKNIIIRSSSLNEDGLVVSNAGKYDSIKLNKINLNNLNKSIHFILKKFKNQNDQILVQTFIQKPEFAGVLFTKEKKNNSDYYQIEYDKSKRSDLVTTGLYTSSNKLLLIRKNTKKFPKRFSKLILISQKLQKLFNNDRLDIEFCIKNNFTYILQCRHLPGAPKSLNNETYPDLVTNLRKKFNKLNNNIPNIFGNRTILSNMSDWNPAEMIGARPSKLALSLYANLITNDIWAIQRSNYGYKDVQPNRLMLNFSGLPYIDLRIDLNSFLPKDIDKKLSEKIINSAIFKLKSDPSLHDKIEFNIIDTCYNFELETNKKKFLNNRENLNYINSLKKLTNNLINSKKNLLEKEFKKINTLIRKINILKSSKLSHIQKIYYLIEDCKKYGTLPFAGIARLAFISTNILWSLQKMNLISSVELSTFYNSLNTESKKINNLYRESLIRKNFKKFLDYYGHLRPSMYSINTKNYRSNHKKYFSQNFKHYKFIKKETLKYNFKKLKEIEQLFKKRKIVINFKDFLKFAKKSIELREKSKIYFSKSIDEIFVNLKDLAKEIKIQKNDIENLDINLIIDSFNNLDPIKLKEIIKNNIHFNKKSLKISNSLSLPDVIIKENDFDYYFVSNSKPNYITNLNVVSNVIKLNEIKNLNHISNKIVLIENADPGYDFIFTKKISGLITKYGGANSHMAIRCMEQEIPAIIGVGEKNYSIIETTKKIFIDCKNNFYRKI